MINAKVINYHEIDASKEDVNIFLLIEQAIDEIHTIHKKFADSIVLNPRTSARLCMPDVFNSHQGTLNIVQSNRMLNNELEVRGIGDNTYIVYKIKNIFC